MNKVGPNSGLPNQQNRDVNPSQKANDQKKPDIEQQLAEERRAAELQKTLAYINSGPGFVGKYVRYAEVTKDLKDEIEEGNKRIAQHDIIIKEGSAELAKKEAQIAQHEVELAAKQAKLAEMKARKAAREALANQRQTSNQLPPNHQ